MAPSNPFSRSTSSGTPKHQSAPVFPRSPKDDDFAQSPRVKHLSLVEGGSPKGAAPMSPPPEDGSSTPRMYPQRPSLKRRSTSFLKRITTSLGSPSLSPSPLSPSTPRASAFGSPALPGSPMGTPATPGTLRQSQTSRFNFIRSPPSTPRESHSSPSTRMQTSPVQLPPSPTSPLFLSSSPPAEDMATPRMQRYSTNMSSAAEKRTSSASIGKVKRKPVPTLLPLTAGEDFASAWVHIATLSPPSSPSPLGRRGAASEMGEDSYPSPTFSPPLLPLTSPIKERRNPFDASPRISSPLANIEVTLASDGSDEASDDDDEVDEGALRAARAAQGRRVSYGSIVEKHRKHESYLTYRERRESVDQQDRDYERERLSQSASAADMTPRLYVPGDSPSIYPSSPSVFNYYEGLGRRQSETGTAGTTSSWHSRSQRRASSKTHSRQSSAGSGKSIASSFLGIHTNQEWLLQLAAGVRETRRNKRALWQARRKSSTASMKRDRSPEASGSDSSSEDDEVLRRIKESARAEARRPKSRRVSLADGEEPVQDLSKLNVRRPSNASSIISSSRSRRGSARTPGLDALDQFPLRLGWAGEGDDRSIELDLSSDDEEPNHRLSVHEFLATPYDERLPGAVNVTDRKAKRQSRSYWLSEAVTNDLRQAGGDWSSLETAETDNDEYIEGYLKEL